LEGETKSEKPKNKTNYNKAGALRPNQKKKKKKKKTSCLSSPHECNLITHDKQKNYELARLEVTYTKGLLLFILFIFTMGIYFIFVYR